MPNRLFVECWRPEYASSVVLSLGHGSRGASQVEGGLARVLCLSLFGRHRSAEVLLTAADVGRLVGLMSSLLSSDGVSLVAPAPGDIGSPVDSGFIRFRGGV